MSKQKIIPIIVFLTLLVIAAVTCPSKEDHQKVMLESLNSAIRAAFEEADDGSIFGKSMSLLGSTVASNMIDARIATSFDVDNYLILSTGHVTIKDKEKIVSFGIFGHVYSLISKERIKDAITH